jgi:hypothetical protein
VPTLVDGSGENDFRHSFGERLPFRIKFNRFMDLGGYMNACQHEQE